jgi:hypothetical protein
LRSGRETGEEEIMNTFHLFRAPGEPGYAGTVDLVPDEEEGADVINAAISAAADKLGLTVLASGELLGNCGLELPEDYLEQIAAAGAEAWEKYCG